MTTFEPDPVPATYPDGGGAALYAQLLRSTRTSNRCPVWSSRDPRLGWMPEIGGDVASTIAAVDAGEVLSGRWPGPPGCTCLAPFTGAFPGLLRAGTTDRSTARVTIAEAVSFATEAGDLATWPSSRHPGRPTSSLPCDGRERATTTNATS